MYKNKFKNYFSKSNQLILLTTVFHLFFIGFYPVNDEFIFPVGAKLLETYDVNQIKFYFDFNANTLGFPIIIFLLSKALSINYYLTAKLLSLIGIILICIGSNSFLKLINLKNYKNKHILFLLILLNPLVFIFSFRGTPDFFSASLAFFSITCFIINKKFYLKLI